MHTAPKMLYKYRSLAGECYNWTKEIFLKNELYFPHPDQINDPFDCKIPPNYENVDKEMIQSYLGKSHQTLSPIDSETKSKINVAINNVQHCDMGTVIQALKEKHREGKLQDVGVLSFSEKKLDIRMWSHYSDSHRGICIGFDYAKIYFNFNGAKLPSEKVRYPRSNSYPRWNPIIDDKMKKVEVYFTKSIDWKYEQEWRIVLPEKGRTSQKFNPNALVSVHLGCLITEGHKKEVEVIPKPSEGG